MTSIESVQEVISKYFEHVESLGDGVLRGQRVYKDKPYAVAYVDLSDAVVERSQNLTNFQENLLGADFFSPDSDLRWNSYLYFLAGPKSLASNQFREAKMRIEADRHFARKFVLEADDLILHLCEPAAKESPGPAQVDDVGETWAGILRAASLGSFLDQPARKTTLENIANGVAFKAEATPATSKVVSKADPLANGFLRNLTVGPFRRVNLGKPFAFGDINLIVGANGTGKTSLLEAIEALYCGRVRRGSRCSVDCHYWNAGERTREAGDRRGIHDDTCAKGEKHPLVRPGGFPVQRDKPRVFAFQLPRHRRSVPTIVGCDSRGHQ